MEKIVEQNESDVARKCASRRIKQCTLKNQILLEGIGVHDGKTCKISVDPAPSDSGISYVKDDVSIAASYANVFDTSMCTRIKDASSNTSVSVVEHISAAFYGLGITNAIVRLLEGDEIPFLDGSSVLFAEAILKSGIEEQEKNRKRIIILREVKVGDAKRWASLSPFCADCDDFMEQETNSTGKSCAAAQKSVPQKEEQQPTLQMSVFCDFSEKGLNLSSCATPFLYSFASGDFKNELAPARTFGFFSDVEYLRKNNLALGASLDNTVVFGKNGAVINPEGMRYDNEPVRHKTLDAVGDLSLAGFEIEGCYKAFCPGHGLNNALLRALFGDKQNYRIEDQNEIVSA